MFPRGPGEFHWRADLYLACWSQKMLRSVLSDGERAARVTTDIHPAVNGSLSCSKYCFILLWNPLKDITVSFPQQTIEAAKQKWWYDSSFTCRCFFVFFFIFSDAFVFEKLSDSMEKVRSDLTAVETESEGGGMVGIQSARGPSSASTNPLNFSLRNFGTELR